MSPLGSAACISCLRLIYIRLIRSIRVLLKYKWLVVFLKQQEPEVLKNPYRQCFPCGTKRKQVLAVPMF